MVSSCGHDENNRYKNGKAGDQTGTEYCLRNWYNGKWKCVLRYPNENVGNDLATVAILASNNNLIGYDQNQRLTYYNHLKASGWNPSKVSVACEADCSASTSANVIAIGYRLGLTKLQQLSPSCTTSSLRNALKAIGFEVLTDNKYLISDSYLKKGDILLNDGIHVVINVTNGSKVISSTPTFQSHVANEGWLSKVGNGEICGTTGKSEQLEAIRINPNGKTIKVRVHIANIGWTSFKTITTETEFGTTGQHKAIEAIEMIGVGCNVTYQSHMSEIGWGKTYTNGGISGTVGQGRPIEALKITIK